MQTLFITGIGGFIGRRLGVLARARGLRVRGVDAAPSAVEAARAAGLEAEPGDVTDAARMRELVRGSDAVVHTAAIVREEGALELFRRVNVGGSLNVARAAQAGGSRLFVQLSSVMVYGFDFPPGVDEQGPLRGEGNPYCQTKIESEGAVLGMNTPDFGVIVVRPGDVYGPGSVPWISRPLEMLARRRLVLPAWGRGVINPVYVDDLAEGIFLALEAKAKGEIFNLTSGSAVAYADFFGRLARRAGLPAPLPGPTWLVRGLARAVGALHEHGLVKDEASVETVRYLTRRNAYSIAKAERVLGYRPRFDVEAGLAETQAFIDETVRRLSRAAA